MRAASKLLKQQIIIRRKMHNNNDGFTIIETMIVLAVTGVLFLVAVNAVSGRQNEVEFQQAINDFQSSMQSVISEINSGDYQEANNIQCTQSGTGFNITTVSGSPTEGSNTDCIFVGKVVQFADNKGTPPEEYLTYPIAGLRADSSGTACTDMKNCVNPAVVAPGNSTNSTYPDDSVPNILNNRMTISSINFINGASSQGIGAFAFMSSLGTSPGSQQLYLVPIENSSFTNQDPTNMGNAVDTLDANLATSYDDALSLSNPNYKVEVCLTSGTTNQSGMITIGGNGGDINSVTTTMFTNSTDCS